MAIRRRCFILFCVALPTTLALWAYFYTVSLPFRVVFLKHSIGPLLLWQIPSTFGLTSIMLFTAFLIATFFSCLYLQKKKRPLLPLASFWVLGLTPLILSTSSGKFPEFIPLAFVLLPAGSIAAFLVFTFWGKQIRGVQGIFAPRSAPYTIWVITFFILLSSGLYVCERGGYTGGDEEHYFTIAKSMHEDNDVDLANNIRHYRKRQSPRFHISGFSVKGHAYSWHPVGLSFVLAPLRNEVNDYKETLIIMCIIGAFMASQMYLAVFDETGNTSISLWVWIVLSFSSPLWFYSFRAWPFVPGGLCILYAWRKISHFHENRIYQIVILNLLLTWLLWLHDSFILCYGILGIFLLYYWVRRPRNPKTLATLIFQAVNIGIFFWFHYRWFGKALFAQQSAAFTFWPGMLATWFDHYRGMVFAAPIHLLCFMLIFVYAFKKRNLSGFVLLALYLAGFVIGTAGRYWTGGSCHPGRRLVEIIPLTCVPLGYFLNRRKTPAFYWLVTFLSLLSLSYMSYFILIRGLRLPIGSLALSGQRFRTVCFHLPGFGRSFHNFPWTHVGAVTVSFVLLALFWVLLLLKEGRGRIRFMFTGMAFTLLWIFVSAGWMKTHFDTPSPIDWNTITNCAGEHNRCGIGYPPLERGLYRYLVHGLDKTQEKLSWSVEIKKRLPTYLDLAKGMYRFHLIGTGKPRTRGIVTILEILGGKELCSFPVLVDANGNFSHEIELNLSRSVNRIRVELKPHDERKKSQIIFNEMTITPIPDGLESLISKIEEKGEPSGWIYLN